VPKKSSLLKMIPSLWEVVEPKKKFKKELIPSLNKLIKLLLNMIKRNYKKD
jgi:hypothetical protein